MYPNEKEMIKLMNEDAIFLIALRLSISLLLVFKLIDIKIYDSIHIYYTYSYIYVNLSMYIIIFKYLSKRIEEMAIQVSRCIHRSIKKKKTVKYMRKTATIKINNKITEQFFFPFCF